MHLYKKKALGPPLFSSGSSLVLDLMITNNLILSIMVYAVYKSFRELLPRILHQF